MALIDNLLYILVNPSGGTISNSISDGYTAYKIYGGVTLTSNLSFTMTEDPFDGAKFVYYYNGNLNTLGHDTHVFFHGVELPQDKCQSQWEITAVYSGNTSSWIVIMKPDFTTEEVVDNDNIMTGVVDLTKLLALDDAKFIIGTSDGNIQTTITGDVVISDAGVAAIQAGVIVNTDISSTANIAITKIANGTTGQILLTNGSTNTWTTVSGDGSISPTGGLTVTNKTVTFANEGTRATTVPAFVGQIGVQIDTSIIYTANSTTEGDWIPYLQSGSLITFSGTVTSGNILTLNGTTYPIILAPGAGNIIEPVSLYAEVNYIGAAYASNTGLAVVYHGSTVPLAVANNVLASTTNGLKCRFSFVDSSSSTSSQVLINQSLDLYVPGGDPTGGTSTVYYQGTYRIIQGLT